MCLYSLSQLIIINTSLTNIIILLCINIYYFILLSLSLILVALTLNICCVTHFICVFSKLNRLFKCLCIDDVLLGWNKVVSYGDKCCNSDGDGNSTVNLLYTVYLVSRVYSL